MGSTNILLEHLPRKVLDRLAPDLRTISLMRGESIHRPGDKIRQLYFPTSCMISVSVTMGDGRTVEAGAVGNREVVGINAFMGDLETTQTEYVVQIPGDALRIAINPFRAEFDRNTEMRDVMLRYTQAFVAQISQNVACNRLHTTTQRFARFLLEVRDRVRSNRFTLTHEFMAEILGIRRASVTCCALKLKKMGIIEYNRGQITITELSDLESMACECYTVIKGEYDRLLG